MKKPNAVKSFALAKERYVKIASSPRRSTAWSAGKIRQSGLIASCL